jgi:hypothetical protein
MIWRKKSLPLPWSIRRYVIELIIQRPIESILIIDIEPIPTRTDEVEHVVDIRNRHFRMERHQPGTRWLSLKKDPVAEATASAKIDKRGISTSKTASKQAKRFTLRQEPVYQENLGRCQFCAALPTTWMSLGRTPM